MFKNLDICWDVSKCSSEENVMDLAFSVQHFDNGLEKDIGAM